MRSPETLQCLATMRPAQLVFNVQVACEMANITLQGCLNSIGDSGDWACLSVVIAYAFNTRTSFHGPRNP